jgi:hypothetical protein
MDMNTDAVNIASRRLQVDSVRPVTQKPQTTVEERLIPHSSAETDGDIKRKRHDEESASKRNAHDYRPEDESDAEAEGDESSPLSPHLGDDGEEHLLDVRV